MCGIAGIHHLENSDTPVSQQVLDAMTDAVAHRGPDGRGTIRFPGIGLGHRRLSIIDPTDAGHQPMGTPAGDVWIAYNGEIYNFQELRKELGKKGYAFRSRTDTEVLLNSFLEWDLDCLEKLNGIFAFAIWDGRSKRLWLVRDPLGVKPLFYSVSRGQLSFASEIQALWKNPAVERRADPEGLDAFLTFSFVPAPLTGYSNVKQLLPGQWLLAERGSIRCRKYWDLPVDAPKLRESDAELHERFGELWRDVIRRQRVADVPVGCFLSGGVDSFSVARALQSVSEGQAKAFTMGFREPSFDESALARLAATSLGVDFHSDLLDIQPDEGLSEIFGHAQEPFADSSMLAVYKLSQLTRRKVKVALSGDGADELLAGYPTYRASQVAPFFRIVPRSVREHVLPWLIAKLPHTGKKYAPSQLLSRFVYGANRGKWKDHASWRVICTDAVKKEIYSPELLELSRGFDPLERYWGPMQRLEGSGLSDLDIWLYADLTFYLPNDMLVKVDRMSMAHGLEVRVPYLDRELVEFCWRLPDHLKMNWREGKAILRGSERPYVPKALARIPKKGFNVPIERWFRDGRLTLSASSRRPNLFTELLNGDGIAELERSHRGGRRELAHVLFCLALLQRF